jgi:rhodanese-related sulfurtransferase
MLKSVKNWLLPCLLVTIFCSGSLFAEEKKETYGTIDTGALQVLQDYGTEFYLIDARPSKIAGVTIPGAINLSYKSEPEEIASKFPGKRALYIVFCGNVRCPMSHHLAKKMVLNGYPYVLVYKDGMSGWKKSNR